MIKENPKRKVVTRFAPSPTGHLHMGGVRTALFAYIFARKNGGKFILRIEDTDKERSTKEFDQAILDGMKWLNLPYDELYRQSERAEIYKKFLNQLVDSGAAFLSREAEVLGKRTEVIRFKNPNKKVKFTDLVRGDIEFDTTELGDFVIAKSTEEPIFHMAVVIDDAEMGVTHIIRGEDHISNTPRQILIQEALGLPRPIYAHLPLVLAPDRTKLSKRRHGELVSLPYYKNLGYLPEAILNFLALIGWNPGDNREIFSVPELIKEFDFSKIQKGGAIFNLKKLDWINKEYLRKIPSVKDAISNEIKKVFGLDGDVTLGKVAEKLAPIVLERISKIGDIKAIIDDGELGYFFKKPEYEAAILKWKGETDSTKTKERIEEVSKLLGSIPEADFKKDFIKEKIWQYSEKEGRGEVLWPFRAALSGREKSPDPFTLAEILGKKETLSRLARAVGLL